MNRLQLELHRLYLPPATPPTPPIPPTPPTPPIPPTPAIPAIPAAEAGSTSLLIDDRGMVRALVVEVLEPASWDVLGKVWHGVQSELELPAPGIAVSGIDGLQLWFSLVEAIPVAEAHAFLETLRVRFLGDLPARRIRMFPSSSAALAEASLHAAIVPALQESTGNWSAFIASDLAPVFEDSPWLDIPPGEEGQAGLLRGLRSTSAAALAVAVERLRQADSSAGPMPEPAPVGVERPPIREGSEPALPLVSSPAQDATTFLMRVMNDTAVALVHRIDAAKALLVLPNRRPGRSDDAA